jgi:chemosensory pili system protein ChpA (sensor histidine kinase/response regulator)
MSKKITPEVFEVYREEVRGYLPAVRAALNTFRDDTSNLADLEEARRQIHIIKGSSAMVAMQPLSNVAYEMEQILEALTEKTISPTNELIGLLTTALDVISNSIESADSPEKASCAGCDELQAAFKKLTESLPVQNKPHGTPAHSSRDITPNKPKKIPRELLDVFLLEAEDHYNSIRSMLDELRQDTGNTALIQDMRRTVHTLKGSAGAVGFDLLAGLSHRMEDLLDALYDGVLDMDEDTLNLIAAAADMLEDIAGDKVSTDVLETIYTRLTEKLETATKNISENERRSGLTDRRAEQREPSEAAPGNDFVRVSQDRLDSLIKSVGELVINRSALQQSLTSLDKRMNSLADVVERLRMVSARLETEYELSGLNRREPVPGGDESERQGFDELELDRYTEFHHLLRQLSEAASDMNTFKHEIATIMNECTSISSMQGRLSGAIQEKLMDVRMVPLASLANRLRQIVRVVAQSQGKLVDLVIEGGQFEIDKKVLDEMVDPLMHLIRNNVDHGIETPEERRALGKNERGLIRLRAYYEGSRIVIAISDDGAGLNLERIREAAVARGLLSAEESRSMSDNDLYQIIFDPNLSTAAHISEVSGRGVGMDIVKQQVHKLQGTINLESSPGLGTLLTIHLPMSLSIRRSLLVQAWGDRYAIPLSSLKRIIRVPCEQIPGPDAAQEIVYEKETYPYIHLGRFMGAIPDERKNDGSVPLLMVDVGTRFIALQVDEVLGEREVVVKNLGSLLQRVRGVSGATVLGDGSVILIINPLDIGLPGESVPSEPAKHLWSRTMRDRKQLTVMVVDDSISFRQVVSNLVEGSGWKALRASDGFAAIEMLQSIERRPDIFLLDVEMPRMDGYELLARLKSRDLWRRIPVVMLTSRAGEKHRLRALELGAAEYIVKPYQDDDMRATIRRLVDQSRGV